MHIYDNYDVIGHKLCISANLKRPELCKKINLKSPQNIVNVINNTYKCD